MSDSPVSRAHLGAVVACGLLAAGTAGGDAPRRGLLQREHLHGWISLGRAPQHWQYVVSA